MRQLAIFLILAPAVLTTAAAQTKSNPFLGKWDFTFAGPNGTRACWLGVSDRAGKTEVWYQPDGGNVYQVKDFKLDGSHLSFPASKPSPNRPAATWDLDANGQTLTGVEKRGDKT